MKTKLTILLLFFITSNIFAQIGSPFEKGFNDGFNETLKDAGYFGNYLAYGDSRNCQKNAHYEVNKNIDDKLYADGYRCGTTQATKAIPKIEKNQNLVVKEKVEKANAEHNKMFDNTRASNLSNTESTNQSDADFNKEKNDAGNARQKELYNQQVLQQLKENQIQSQNYYNQEINRTLNSLSKSMQAMSYQTIKNELDRRSNVANNFTNYHSDRINKLTNLYNQIPKNNFKKPLNGLYSASLFNTRKYSFVNNQELVTETSCLVNVENNIVKKIYLYGKEKFELDYPKDYPESSLISNGIVKYSDYATLETVTLLIIEPYISSKTKTYSLNSKGVGFITIWSSDKKNEGKIIYIQEIDKNGNIIREISAPIIYAKNEKSIDIENSIKIPVNSGDKLSFFGEITKTPYGMFPLFPKISKDCNSPLLDNEERPVEIKKYRE
jgi:hypothetical protein